MILRRLWSTIMLVISFAYAGTVRAAHEKCLGTFMGAQLIASLQDLGLTVAAVKLLDGSEKPKLREFLEWRLLSAAADASYYVDQRPEVDAISMQSTVPNWLNVVDRARQYVVSHQLEQAPPPEAEGGQLMPLANLNKVKEWLLVQQKACDE